MEFAAVRMGEAERKMSREGVEDEVRYAWANSYSPAEIERALESIADEPAAYKISHLMSRLFFRGIYFPQKGAWKWLKLAAQNRRAIGRVVEDSFKRWHGATGRASGRDFNGAAAPGFVERAQAESGGD